MSRCQDLYSEKTTTKLLRIYGYRFLFIEDSYSDGVYLFIIKAPKALKWQILSEIHQKKFLICIKPLQERLTALWTGLSEMLTKW